MPNRESATRAGAPAPRAVHVVGAVRAALVALALCAAVVVAGLAPAGAAEPVPGTDPATGYRMDKYRAPTPETAPEGARRIGTAEVKALLGTAVLVDAMAARGGGFDPKTGLWRLAEPRSDIPGSIWLAEVGRGAVDPAIDRYFRAALTAATGGDPAKPIVFYCLADCWMSWNAARRAVGYGYTSVLWYPEGTDGWTEAGGTLVPATPLPVPVD